MHGSERPTSRHLLAMLDGVGWPLDGSGWLRLHRRSQGVRLAQVHPQGEKKYEGAEFMGVSCKFTREGETASPGSGGVTFLLRGGGCGVY